MKLNDRQLKHIDQGQRQGMFPEVESALTYKMFSSSGRKIALSSLRPGDTLQSEFGTYFEVIQNSAALEKVECWNKIERRAIVFDYNVLACSTVYRITYLGHKQLTAWQRIVKLVTSFL